MKLLLVAIALAIFCFEVAFAATAAPALSTNEEGTGAEASEDCGFNVEDMTVADTAGAELKDEPGEESQSVWDYLAEHQREIYLLAKRTMQSEYLADVVVGNSTDKMLKSWETLQKGQSRRSWVYRIVIRAAIDEMRRVKRRYGVMVPLSLDELAGRGSSFEARIDPYRRPYPEQRTPLTHLIQEEVKQMVQEAIPQVELGIYLQLKYVDNLSLEEIARIMGTSVVNVKVRIHRAKIKMREFFAGRITAADIRYLYFYNE